MAFTQTQLDALESAIATGVTEYRIGDKTVKYGTMADMLKAREIMRAELGLTETDAPRYSTAAFYR